MTDAARTAGSCGRAAAFAVAASFVAGCRCGADGPVDAYGALVIEFQLPSGAVVEGDSADVGLVLVGQTADDVVQLRNTGAAPLQVTLGDSDGALMIVSGPASAPFQLASSTLGSLSSGETRALHVTFAPGKPGTFKGGFALEVDGEEGGEKARHVSLTGESVASPRPCAYSVVPAAVDFGKVIPPRAYTFPVAFTNVGHAGDEDCLVGPISLSTGSNPAFAISTPSQQQERVPPGEQLTVEVGLTTEGQTLATVLTGELDLAVASSSSPARVPLKASIGVSCFGATPMVLDFGTVAYGCASRTRAITVSNLCDHDITLLGAGLETGTAAFSMAPASIPAGGLVLRPGIDSVNIDVSFVPYEVGVSTGSVRLRGIDGTESESLLVALRGEVSVSTEQVDRWTQGGGKTDIIFTVDNDDNEPLTGPTFVDLPSRVPALLQYLQDSHVDFHIGVTTYQEGPFLQTGTSAPPIAYETGEFWTFPSSPEPVLDTTTADVLVKLQQKFLLMHDPCGDCDGRLGNLATLSALSSPLETTGENVGFLRSDARLAVVYAGDLAASFPFATAQHPYDPVNSTPISSMELVSRLWALKGTGRESDVTVNAFYSSSPVCGDPSLSWSSFTGHAWQYSYFQEGWSVAATGGVHSDFCPTPNAAQEAMAIAEAASAFRIHFPLSQSPDLGAGTIVVKVDGVETPPGTSTWSYEGSSNRVTFVSASSAPPYGSAIEVSYATFCR